MNVNNLYYFYLMNTENNESFDSERSVELKDLERKNLATLTVPER